MERFRQHDEALLLSTYKHHGDVKKLTEIAIKAREELEELFEQDEQKKTG